MKGLFIPDITAEMFRNGCLESIEALMAEGEIYDIDYEPKRKKGRWKGRGFGDYECTICWGIVSGKTKYCPHCGARMEKSDG